MSGSNNLQNRLTRRSFFKTSGAAVGALGLVGAVDMFSTKGWLAPTEAHAEAEERVVHLCHQMHCLASCHLQCTVRDGRIVLIEPNQGVDKEDRRICLRGISEIQHVYSADRIQTPLKRVGERGEGKFEAITWDEAIKMVADGIKATQVRYGDDSLLIRKSGEAGIHGVDFLASLLHAVDGRNGGKGGGMDRGLANGLSPAFGPSMFYPSQALSEMSKAATIINLGINTLESGLVWSREMLDAHEAGAKIITVDPRFSPTASHFDQWVPVNPGTDTALILGMVRAILDEKWYEEEELLNETSFSFLVEKDSGVSLGKMEDVVDATTKKTIQLKIKMVWDTVTNSAKPFNEEGVVPALEGEWTVDGKRVITELSLMKEQFKQYTLDWASEVSSVDPDVIFNLAKDYATRGPAIINFGEGGPDKYFHCDTLGHALAVITALTGNHGKEGAGTGFYGYGGGMHNGQMKSWTLPAEFKPSISTIAMYDMPYRENNVHAALTFGDAFTLGSANANKKLEWVKTLDFFAIVDIYHSSIVDYADVVLPACTKFECEEDTTDLRGSMNYIALGQKAIDPLFESKTDLQVERLLAAEWGYDKYLPKTHEEFSRHRLSEVSPNMKGMTFEALSKGAGVMRLIGSEVPKTGNRERIYPTGSTRPEVYYEDFIKEGQAFPHYEHPDEAYEDNPLREKYPLIFMQGKTRFRIHAYYSASSWFREYYGPAVNMSPEDAKDRGLVTGDEVEVFNGRGDFVCRVLVNPSIRKGTTFMAETTYTRYYKRGFLQNVTNSARNDRADKFPYGPMIPFNDTLVEIKKA